MPPTIYIGFIMVPPSVEMKLRQRRGLTGRDVRETFEWPAVPVATRWHWHDEHGRRVIAIGDSSHGLLKAILQPVDVRGGTWRLRTCVIAGRADRV